MTMSENNSKTIIITSIITAVTTITVTLISSGYFKEESIDQKTKHEIIGELRDSLQKMSEIKNPSLIEVKIQDEKSTSAPSKDELETHLNVVTSNNNKKVVESYERTELSGTVSFDYSSNNGRFKIGADRYLFTTKWSTAGTNSIHTYNDEIVGVAMDKEIKDINHITNFSDLDFSSRVRTPSEGDIIIIKNGFDNFAALQIIDVSNKDRGDERDELKFEYVVYGRK